MELVYGSVFAVLGVLLVTFVIAGVRRLIADSNVVDDHPDEELPLIRDRKGRAEGLQREHLLDLPSGPPGFEKALEVMAKDLDDGTTDEPPRSKA